MKSFWLRWRRRFVYGIAAVLVLLIITNPSLNNLKDYLGFNTNQRKVARISRNKNFLMFSIYKKVVFVNTNSYNLYSGYDKDVYYLGILSNFFKLN